MHRELQPHEDLNEIFCWHEKRTLSKCLTVQYDKVVYLIDNTVENQKIAGKRVTVFDYYDGSIKIKHEKRELPYSIFDKLRKVDQGEVVSNKRLGAVLQYSTEKQKERDDVRSTSCPARRHLGRDSTTAMRKKLTPSKKRTVMHT